MQAGFLLLVHGQVSGSAIEFFDDERAVCQRVQTLQLTFVTMRNAAITPHCSTETGLMCRQTSFYLSMGKSQTLQSTSLTVKKSSLSGG